MAQPTYIFRGHTAQIHALKFWRQNSRLISADADGWLVIWDVLQSLRPVAVWRPHKAAVLGIEVWGEDKIITHGRDETVRVWQLPLEAEAGLEKSLPIDIAAEAKQVKDPWLLHSIKSHTVSFCTISTCKDVGNSDSLLMAGPAEALGSVEILRLPDEAQLHTVSPPKSKPPSMLMSLELLNIPGTGLVLLTGTEGGSVAVRVLSTETESFLTVYESSCHTQPVLSISSALDLKCFFSSAADAKLVKHSLDGKHDDSDKLAVKTGHAGQQGLEVRSDERIFATAGWDSRVRIYSTKTCAEVAVLKWHKEACYSLGFAEVLEDANEQTLAISQTENQITVPTAKDRRLHKMKYTHWLAAGSKDGKVSLWDIF